MSIFAITMKGQGIYTIRSLKFPNRIYVGSASNFYTRWEHHKTDLRQNKHDNIKLQRHFNKYGLDDLEFEIIEDGPFIDRMHMLAREQMWFSRLAAPNSELPYFNLSPIAGCNIGVKYSEESKRKMSEVQKGKKITQETRQKLREFNLGRKPTQEQRDNQARSQWKQVYQYTLDGYFIKEWPSLKEAGASTGVKRNGISECAGRKRRKAGNFIWRFKSDVCDTSRLPITEWANKNTMSFPIIQMDKSGNEIKHWDSIKQAGRNLGLDDGSIGQCCKGIRKTAGGYKWKYQDKI